MPSPMHRPQPRLGNRSSKVAASKRTNSLHSLHSLTPRYQLYSWKLLCTDGVPHIWHIWQWHVDRASKFHCHQCQIRGISTFVQTSKELLRYISSLSSQFLSTVPDSSAPFLGYLLAIRMEDKKWSQSYIIRLKYMKALSIEDTHNPWLHLHHHGSLIMSTWACTPYLSNYCRSNNHNLIYGRIVSLDTTSFLTVHGYRRSTSSFDRRSSEQGKFRSS